MLPYAVLAEGSEVPNLGNLLEDAKAAFVRLAGGGCRGKARNHERVWGAANGGGSSNVQQPL
jgi:hypothetical protein